MMDDSYIQFVDYYIRLNWHKMSRMYNNIAKEHDITISMGYILLIIEKEGSPSTQLGPKMGMGSTSLSRTLKAMEDKGLIFRQQAKGDFRQVLIFLTEEGVRLRKITKDTIASFNEKLKEKIGENKLKILFNVMEDINKVVSDEIKSIKN